MLFIRIIILGSAYLNYEKDYSPLLLASIQCTDEGKMALRLFSISDVPVFIAFVKLVLLNIGSLCKFHTLT